MRAALLAALSGLLVRLLALLIRLLLATALLTTALTGLLARLLVLLSTLVLIILGHSLKRSVHRFLDVGLCHLAYQLGPIHIHRSIDRTGLGPTVVFENFDHQRRVVR